MKRNPNKIILEIYWVQGEKLIKNLVRKLKRHIDEPFRFRNIYRPKKLSYYCNTKDKVPEYLKSHIVYVNFVAQPVIVNILEKQIEILAPVFKSRVVRTKVTGLQSFAGMWTYQLCGKLA